jgi:hypothetical protein
MVPPVSRECGLLVVVLVGDLGVLVGGGDLLEPTVRNGCRCSFQTFPQDLVVEVGGNAVFAREVEAAGFRSPVFGVMSRLQVGTVKVQAPDEVMSNASAIGRV